ncbi:MAG: GNAT family N-acetyltransferase [Bacteroidetes bacterium]|nr:N-acetyltransferase [Rhodothermaceae bacterium RA]RMH58026.1 MAG: GNAT family N-acetyltransferase [Bacteroidota bacterium]
MADDTAKAAIHLEIREGLDGLTPARIVTLYRRAPLLRPVDRNERVWEMFEKASLVLTAWRDGDLVGIARVLTDGVLYSYLCDLAVEPDVQRHGVGKALLHEIFERCKGTELVLRDSDISASYYAHLGFQRVGNAWVKYLR